MYSPPPPIMWEGGGQHTLWPPNNPPTFVFNFYVKQEKITNVLSNELKDKIIINVTLIWFEGTCKTIPFNSLEFFFYIIRF